MSGGPPTAKPVNVLLVEDNPADVELTRLSLEETRLAHNLHVTLDGDQALAFGVDQREHRHEDGEEGDDAESPVGDDLVVGGTPQADAVRGERGGRANRQDQDGSQECDGEADWNSLRHGWNSISAGRAAAGLVGGGGHAPPEYRLKYAIPKL